MSKASFMSDNLVKNSTLTLVSGTGDAQYPLNNIKHDFSTKVFRSTGTSCSILIDTLAISQVDMICLRGSLVDGIGFTSATIEGSATPVFSGTPISVDISTTENFAFKELTLSSFRYWKLVLTGSSYVELSNIFLGTKVQMQDNNISIGFQYSLKTNNQLTVNEFGMRFIDQYNKLKLLSGSILYANSTEFDQLNTIHRDNGTNTPIWFILDATSSLSISDSKYIFSGMFYIQDLEWNSISQDLYNVDLVFEEAA